MHLLAGKINEDRGLKNKNSQIGACGSKSLESPDTGKLLGLLQKTTLYPFISILELGKTSDSHQHVFNFTGWPIIYYTFILQLQENFWGDASSN